MSIKAKKRVTNNIKGRWRNTQGKSWQGSTGCEGHKGIYCCNRNVLYLNFRNDTWVCKGIKIHQLLHLTSTHFTIWKFYLDKNTYIHTYVFLERILKPIIYNWQFWHVHGAPQLFSNFSIIICCPSFLHLP